MNSPIVNRPSTAEDAAHASWRRIVEWVLPLLAVATTVVVPLAVWGRLPDPMASHWALSGVPDDALPKISEVLLITLVTAIVGIGPLLALRVRFSRWSTRVLVALAVGGSGLFATLRVLTVRANLDAATWEAAAPLPWSTALVTLVVGGVLGAVGVWLAGDRPDPPVTTSPPADVEVVPGEAVVWSGGASSRFGTVVPAALLALTAGSWWIAGPARNVVLIVLPLVALVATLVGEVRVTVGPRGLTAGLGWLGWPRLRVPIDQITDVRVEDVEPTAYGGWGLRFVPGATAVVIRRGEAIRVERTGRRVLVVTVDDAARGAGVLLAHLPERATRG